MSSENIESIVNRRYEHGFVTDIETESLPPGLNEGVVRAISARKVGVYIQRIYDSGIHRDETLLKQILS